MTFSSKQQHKVDALPKLKPGLVIKDRYVVEEFIGAGTSARVYRCRDRMLGNLPIAFKVYPSTVTADKTTEARVNRELLSSFGVDHSNIARFYECIRTKDFIGMVMEYVEGDTLYDILDRGDVMSLMKVLHLLQQVCFGLQAIHDAGVLHRDFKPANIMITKNGDVKITDFGLAKFNEMQSDKLDPNDDTITPSNKVKRSTVTEVNDVVGTPLYLSPEYLDSGQCDERSDIYALGIIAYELITGQIPFTYENFYQLVESKMHATPALPHELNPACPPELGAIIMKAMAVDPRERFQSPKEVAEAIDFFKRRRYQTMTELSNAVTISKLFTQIEPEEAEALKEALQSGAIDMIKMQQREREKRQESEDVEESEGVLMELGDVLADNIGLLLLLFFFIAVGLALVLADTQGVEWGRVLSDLKRAFSGG